MLGWCLQKPAVLGFSADKLLDVETEHWPENYPDIELIIIIPISRSFLPSLPKFIQANIYIDS
jgi:hypothetical protein